MIKVGFKSDRGAKRRNNEDSCFVMPKEHVYVVADGVGGGNSGETASNMAVTTVAQKVKLDPIKKAKNSEQVFEYMQYYIEFANRAIINYAAKHLEHIGMATTIVLCHINGEKAYFANAGDSRAYIYRKGELCQITEDHSYLNTLINKGAVINEEDVKENNHMIMKALGAENEVNADYYQTDLEEGDVIILCSDGLYNEVSKDEMSRLIESEEDMIILADKLVERANDNGGNDNITVICLKLKGEA